MFPLRQVPLRCMCLGGSLWSMSGITSQETYTCHHMASRSLWTIMAEIFLTVQESRVTALPYVCSANHSPVMSVLPDTTKVETEWSPEPPPTPPPYSFSHRPCVPAPCTHRCVREGISESVGCTVLLWGPERKVNLFSLPPPPFHKPSAFAHQNSRFSIFYIPELTAASGHSGL